MLDHARTRGGMTHDNHSQRWGGALSNDNMPPPPQCESLENSHEEKSANKLAQMPLNA